MDWQTRLAKRFIGLKSIGAATFTYNLLHPPPSYSLTKKKVVASCTHLFYLAILQDLDLPSLASEKKIFSSYFLKNPQEFRSSVHSSSPGNRPRRVATTSSNAVAPCDTKNKKYRDIYDGVG